MLIEDENLAPHTMTTSCGVTSSSHDDAALSLSTTLNRYENVPPLTISGVVLDNTKEIRLIRPGGCNKNLTVEKREQINAKRRASYQKKREMLIEDEKLTLHTISTTLKNDENLTPLTVSGNVIPCYMFPDNDLPYFDYMSLPSLYLKNKLR